MSLVYLPPKQLAHPLFPQIPSHSLSHPPHPFKSTHPTIFININSSIFLFHVYLIHPIRHHLSHPLVRLSHHHLSHPHYFSTSISSSFLLPMRLYLILPPLQLSLSSNLLLNICLVQLPLQLSLIHLLPQHPPPSCLPISHPPPQHLSRPAASTTQSHPPPASESISYLPSNQPRTDSGAMERHGHSVVENFINVNTPPPRSVRRQTLRHEITDRTASIKPRTRP